MHLRSVVPIKPEVECDGPEEELDGEVNVDGRDLVAVVGDHHSE